MGYALEAEERSADLGGQTCFGPAEILSWLLFKARLAYSETWAIMASMLWHPACLSHSSQPETPLGLPERWIKWEDFSIVLCKVVSRYCGFGAQTELGVRIVQRRRSYPSLSLVCLMCGDMPLSAGKRQVQKLGEVFQGFLFSTDCLPELAGSSCAAPHALPEQERSLLLASTRGDEQFSPVLGQTVPHYAVSNRFPHRQRGCWLPQALRLGLPFEIHLIGSLTTFAQRWGVASEISGSLKGKKRNEASV